MAKTSHCTQSGVFSIAFSSVFIQPDHHHDCADLYAYRSAGAPLHRPHSPVHGPLYSLATSGIGRTLEWRFGKIFFRAGPIFIILEENIQDFLFYHRVDQWIRFQNMQVAWKRWLKKSAFTERVLMGFPGCTVQDELRCPAGEWFEGQGWWRRYCVHVVHTGVGQGEK